MALKTGFQNEYKFNPFAADLHREKIIFYDRTSREYFDQFLNS